MLPQKLKTTEALLAWPLVVRAKILLLFLRTYFSLAKHTSIIYCCRALPVVFHFSSSFIQHYNRAGASGVLACHYYSETVMKQSAAHSNLTVVNLTRSLATTSRRADQFSAEVREQRAKLSCLRRLLISISLDTTDSILSDSLQ